MKTGLVVCGPDVANGPLALLTGTFEEKLSKAARLGYDGIELMVRDPGRLDWEAIRACVDAAGLEVPQVVTGEIFGADGLCLVTGDDDLYRRAVARTRSVVDLAAFLGAMVNVGRLRGRLSFLGPVADPWGIAVERLRALVEYAAERSVRICFEPINRYETDFILTAAEGRRLIDDLGYDNLGLMMDTFHMNIEEATIEEGFRVAGSRLWHVHIADSNRRYPGCGHLNFGSILGVLQDMGYDGYVSAELLPLPDAETAGIKTIEYLRRYLPAK